MTLKRLIAGSVLLLAILAGLAACGGTSDSAEPFRRLIILHTTDEHSYQLGVGPEVDDYPPSGAAGEGTLTGGTGRRATIFAIERAKAEQSGAAHVTFSSGDNMMGTLFEAASMRAAPDYRAMKQLGYHAGTFGNHDFELSPGFLAASIRRAQASGGMFPIVATNITFAGTPADAPLAALFDETGTDMSKPIRRWHVMTASNGIRIGLVGIMGGHAAYDAPGKYPVTFSRAASGRDDDFDGILQTIYGEVQPVVDYLRTVQKVDLVIALGHTGTDPANPGTGESFDIARNVTGIDVFLSGHTHMKVGPVLVRNPKSGKDVILIESGRYGDSVGKLSLVLDGEGNVTMERDNSLIIPVTGTIPADPSLRAIVDESIRVLEAEPEHGGSGPSMLERTLSQIEGETVVHDPAVTGDLFFRTLGRTSFALPLRKAPVETPLLRLLSDAFLHVVNGISPTRISMIVHGITRDGIWLGKNRTISFADVFRIFPMGQSPLTPDIADYTPGFPLTRFAISASELKVILDMSIAAAYGSTEGIDNFMVPSGLRYEFDSDRQAFDPSDPLNPDRGLITRLIVASDPSAPDNLDTVIYDRTQGGWLINPAVTFFSMAVDYDIALFAGSKGISLRNPENINEIYPLPPLGAVVKRPDGTEQKSYEALGSYIVGVCRANGGYLPDRYGPDTPARRVICTGTQCRQ